MLQSTEFHEFAATGQCRNRKAVAQCLAKRGKVRLHVVDLLPTTQGPTESSDGLVEDEQRAVAMGEIAQPVEESVDGLVGAAGLEHDAGNVVRVFGEDLFRARQVV